MTALCRDISLVEGYRRVRSLGKLNSVSRSRRRLIRLNSLFSNRPFSNVPLAADGLSFFSLSSSHTDPKVKLSRKYNNC